MKITLWRCDICKREFREGDSGFDANTEIEIIIPSASQYESRQTFSFSDTCLDCRVNLFIAIQKLIKQDVMEIP